MEIYKKPKHVETRWINFENYNGKKGQGGLENIGAKGHAFERLLCGETKTLMDFEGEGIIKRIWLTINERDKETLKAIHLRMYWDESETPAVDVPLGDFFCVPHGLIPFESKYFSSPEGRSFNCFIPMPFKKHAKITLTNNSSFDMSLFYEIAVVLKEVKKEDLYFHAHYSSGKTVLGEEFNVLPMVFGEGLVFGLSFGIKTDATYKNSWWGEGAVKIFLDDDQNPTLVGTGLEDYIGTAWGQGVYANQTHGSLINDDPTGLRAFYRFHKTDPIYFNKNIKVNVQAIGGAPYRVIQEFLTENVQLIPISVDQGNNFIKLFEQDKSLHELNLNENNWVNFFRCDDYAIVTYFYSNKTE